MSVLYAAVLTAALFTDPTAVVRDFYARYTAGDLRGVEASWVDRQSHESHPSYRSDRARLQKRCMQLQSLSVDVVSEDPPVFDVTAAMTLRVSPDSPEWWESSRSRITLQRDGGGWRITSWEPRERELIDRLAAEDGAGWEAILDASKELQTTTFVRLAAQRGIGLINQGKIDAADRVAAAALAAAERLGEPAAMSMSLSARSIVQRHRLQMDASLTAAEQATELAEGSGDPDVLARALVSYTRIREVHHGVPPREPAERALALAAELEDVAIAAHAAVHLGRFYELRAEYREAFRYAELASGLADESGDPAAIVSAERLLNGAYVWTGEFDVGNRHSLRAVEVERQANFHLDAATRIAETAAQTAARGNFAEALRILNGALERMKDSRSAAILYGERAIVHTSMGDFDAASRDLDLSATARPVDPAWRQLLYADRAVIAFLRGRDEDALRFAAEAVTPVVPVGRSARHLRGTILLRNGRLDEARHLMETLIAEGDAAQVIEPQRSLFHGLQHPTHRMLIELLVQHGDGPAAFRVTEELKGKALSAAVTGGKTAVVLTAEERAREQSIEERMRELNRRLHLPGMPVGEAPGIAARIADVRAELVDFRQRIYATRFMTRNSSSGELCPDELPAHLDDVTLVSYVVGPQHTMVFVLEPKRNGRRELIVRPIEIQDIRLEERVQQLAALVGQRNLRAPEAAAEMYELLLRPIESSIRDARKLCIIPDGALWHVPFQALGADGGPPLVERVPLFYAPSVTVLSAAGSKREERRADEKPRLLAFANPTVEAKTASLYRAFDPAAPLGAIPETESEVRAIARIYGSESSRVYIGKTAREATLKEEASRFDVLHIATHGVVYDQSPMFSSLLLTTAPSDEQDDGVLEAREIAALALDSDLTVLSACETGRAGALSGGGVIGLAWAFLAAGSPTTVVSQWKAHSAATATLMVEFHRQLARGLSKPEALRHAQLTLRRDRRYRHPFYWAPFMVIGRP